MGTDDAASLATLLAAAEAVDEFGEHYDEDDVREHFMADTIDLEHDTRVAVRDGTIVACGAVVGQVVMREVHTRVAGRSPASSDSNPCATGSR